jgi:hypothetical protein
LAANFQQGPWPGRPRRVRPSEVARALIEAHELALQRPYWRTLGFDVRLGANGPELVELEDGGAKLYGVSGKDGNVRVSVHDDLEAMQRAAERLQDRVYGKPKQTAEVTTVDGGTLAPVLPPDDPGHRRSRNHRRRGARGCGCLTPCGASG